MKKFEILFHSSGEEYLEGFCQEIRKSLAEEASKEAVSNLFHLGLTSIAALLLL